LAIGLLTDRSAVLMRDSYRILALFEPTGLIDNPLLRRLCPRAIYDNGSEVDAGIALDELSDAL
jgi:hypothetical protein